jgi:hypothetical protein
MTLPPSPYPIMRITAVHQDGSTRTLDFQPNLSYPVQLGPWYADEEKYSHALITHFTVEVAPPQCTSHALKGVRCRLLEGHTGPHTCDLTWVSSNDPDEAA